MEGSLLLRCELADPRDRDRAVELLSDTARFGIWPPELIRSHRDTVLQLAFFLATDPWRESEAIAHTLARLGAGGILGHLAGDEAEGIVFFDGAKLCVLDDAVAEQPDPDEDEMAQFQCLERIARAHPRLGQPARPVQAHESSADAPGERGLSGEPQSVKARDSAEEANTQREEQWKQVQHSLKTLRGFFPADAMPVLRHCYVNGLALPDAVRKRLKHGIALFVELWFDPEDSIARLREKLRHADTQSPGEAGRAAARFFQLSREFRFDTCYGMMGGREEVLVRLFVPDQSSEDFIVFQIQDNTTLSPYLFLQTFCHAGQYLLTAEMSSPYNAFQYLAPYWVSCWRHACAHAERDIPNAYNRKKAIRQARSALKVLLMALEAFDSAGLQQCKRANAEAFRDVLIQTLRSPEFPSEVLSSLDASFLAQ